MSEVPIEHSDNPSLGIEDSRRASALARRYWRLHHEEELPSGTVNDCGVERIRGGEVDIHPGKTKQEPQGV